jgi:transcriptional regulator with GAF, ATPase, and Fis domain
MDDVPKTTDPSAELVVVYQGWSRRLLLGSEPVVLGRSEDCDLLVPDRQLSRHHCRIARAAGGGWTVEDLGSRHGTLVSGVPIQGPTPVGPEDRVQIGECEVRLEIPAVESRPFPQSVELLLQTIDDLYGTEAEGQLLRTVVDRAIRVAGGDRGALLLAGQGGSLEAAVARDAGARDLPPDAVLTRSVPDRVLATGRAVVLADTAQDAEPSSTPQSVVHSGLRSVLCVPLPGAGGPIGVLYVDARRPAEEFGPAELAVFEALATHGAVAIERARLREDRTRREAEERRRLEAENAALKSRLEAGRPIGQSESMRLALGLLEKVAASDATVCLTGETGTGKEVCARYLHALGARAGGPFVVVDCGAIPEGLIESELFGHEKGAYTGATAARKGLLREADGGTVFLDEIGELPVALQPKLLRGIQERAVQPVGGSRPVPVDVRFVCATNRDLTRRVEQGLFREDLYYRVAVLTVPIPPLRDRGADVLLLARHFLAHFAAVYGSGAGGFTREAERALLAHRWPGNVRELEHRVQRAALLARPPLVTQEDLGIGLPQASVAPAALQEARAAAVERFERSYFEDLLRRTRGNVSRAAELAGISRQFCQKLIRRHGLERQRFVPGPG